ncbi:MAG: aminotransferase class III-fold pyridoxal phosphate-dependent enzyme, partial [Desulfobacterales bacterium]|nr:aminotransferase class III-fold pyridoxal phosphate-dependent enzyme [Desulfobacterales bacterium]
GELFGVDHWNVKPDIMCFGKALGGGVVPMSAFMATPEVWSCMEPNPFMHTTTTGGNPLACASALAQIDVLLEEDLAGQAAEKGEYIIEKITALQKKYPNIIEGVRGKGLLLGMVFPSDEIGYKVTSGLFSRKVLTAGTLTNSKVFRIEPALNVPYELIDEMLVRLEDTLASIS